MKKSFTWRSILSMILALILCVSLPVTIWAETTTEIVDNGDGTTTNVTTTTTTDTDGDKTIVTVTVKETTEGTTTDGVIVDRDVTTTTITTTDAASTQTTTEESGSESKTYTEEIKPGEKVPSLDLDLTTGGSASVTGDPVKNEPTGDLPTDENDKSYNYTESESTIEREAEGSIKIEESFVINPDESSLNCPVAPEDYDGKQYYEGNENYRDGLLTGVDKDYLEDLNAIAPKPDDEDFNKGFDMTWTGYGDFTDGAASVIATEVVYLTDEEGNVIYENGFPVVDMEKSTFVNGKNGKAIETGMIGQSVMFALKHENGEYFYAYCMDASTGAGPDDNRWYNVRNLEDAIESDDNPDGYLTEDDAAMIRAIANNGYWGTESGQGSLENLKALLKETYDESSVINVRYPGSNEPHTKNIYELIDGLTEHEALAVTQAAIWTFANNNDFAYNQGSYGGMVEDGTVIGILSAYKFQNSKGGWLNEYKPAMDLESDARLQALYYALLGLDPIYADSDLREDSFVIPNEGVFSEVSLTINEKIEDAVDEEDPTVEKDAYNTDLNFKLAFIPTENDDLLVQITYVDLDGVQHSMVKRLAGKNAADEDYPTILPDSDGNYTITGLKLSENSDFVFDFELKGTQYLENGVYIYQAEGGRRESQTLVGLAQGSQQVVVNTTLTLNFNVDEMKTVKENNYWSDYTEPESETDPIPDPTDPTPDDNDPTPDDTDPTPDDNEPTPFTSEEEIRDEEVPLDEEPEEDFEEDDEIEIIDEEIPLAEVPETGDASDIMMLVVIFAVIGLIVVNLPMKKRFNA